MSEPTLIDLPAGLRWIKLVCRLGRLVTDSAADENAYPDLVPVGGKLTLSATPSRVRIKEADGRWRSVDVAGRAYTIRSDGELVDEEGRVGVYIPDPASTLVEPQGYTIGAVVKPTGGAEWRVTVGGDTVLPDVVDLVAVSSVGSVSPTVTASFDARLYALETGGGVDVSQVVEDYLTANPPAGGGGGVTDHGLLTGLEGDDHPQYALADGTRGTYAPALDPDDNYVTDAEKAALHSHANKTALDAVSGVNTGDQDLSGYATTASLADVATSGAYADLTGTPTASHEALTIDGDTTLPSEHQVITLRVSSPATLSIADAPDGTVITAHVAYGWEDITWAPGIVVQGETSTTETWLVLVRSEGEWKVLVSGESADSGGGDSDGGSIAGLNVITGSWPPPLSTGEYPVGTLYIRDPQEYDGPLMAVRGWQDWQALAVDQDLVGGDGLSAGAIDISMLTTDFGEVVHAGWELGKSRSEGFLYVQINSVPEPGDILCTFDYPGLTDLEQNILLQGTVHHAGVLTGTGMVMREDYSREYVGIHNLTIDPYEGIKYLWPVAGASLTAGDMVMLTWPATIPSEAWFGDGGGGGGSI